MAAGTDIVWSESAKSFVISGSNPVQTIPTKLYEYDGIGRLSAVELPAVPDPGNANQLTRPRYEYGYNGQGKQTLIRDALGRETRFTFDAQGRQLTRTLPIGFGPDGKLGTADDGTLPEGPFRERFEYDNQGREELHVSFEGVVAQSIYDSYGRISQQKFFATEAIYSNGVGSPGEVWTYKYDAYGRQVEVKLEPAGEPVRVVTMQYDAEGRLTAQSTPEGVLGYIYDNLGRKAETRVFPAGANPATATPERTTNYTYDALGRLKTVVEDLDPASTSDSPLSTDHAYDLLGNLDRTDLPNGIVTDYAYDQLSRLDKMTDFAPDETPADLSNNPKLAEYDYTVRADGKRTGLTETFWVDEDSNPSTPATTRVNQIAWTYDDVGRLKDEVFNSFDNTLDQTEHIVYDLVGNRLSSTRDKGNNASIDEATSHSYDANDRLLEELFDSDNSGTTDQTTAYGWDHTQQTSKSVTSQGSSITAQDFSYDLQGRLSRVVNKGYTSGALTSRQRISYDYDDAGIRIGSLLEADPNLNEQYQLSSRTEFLVDHHNFTSYQQVIKETSFDAQGVVTKTVEYTFGHDEIAQTVTPYVDGVADTANAATHTFGHDGHGSVRVLTGIAGAMAQMFAFDAFGQMLAIWNASGQLLSGGAGQYANPALALTTLLYSGEQLDTHIGQQYLRARYFDARTGRFNQLDPYFGDLELPQSLHKYSYAHGDPANLVDPTGRWGAVVGAIGFSANIFRGIIMLHQGFEAHWGIGYAIAMSFDYDTADPIMLAELHQLSAELMLMDIQSEMTRGIGVAARASAVALQTIEELIEWNIDLLFDLVTSTFFARACFAAGTPVVVGVNTDGTLVTKPIEEIRAGELVLARDERNEDAPLMLRRVEEVFSRETDSLRTVEVCGDNGRKAVFQTTDGHPFFVQGKGWIEAGKLEPGDRLAGPDELRRLTVTSAEPCSPSEKCKVFTFRVGTDHTYFVADSLGIAELAVWVHNGCSAASQAEEASRVRNGIDPAQTRAARTFAGEGTKTGKRIADGVKDVAPGVKHALEYKHISNWARSIYNRLSPIGAKAWAQRVTSGLVTQVRDYLKTFQHLIYESNSKELLDQLRKQLLDAGEDISRITFRHVP